VAKITIPSAKGTIVIDTQNFDGRDLPDSLRSTRLSDVSSRNGTPQKLDALAGSVRERATFAVQGETNGNGSAKKSRKNGTHVPKQQLPMPLRDTALPVANQQRTELDKEHAAYVDSLPIQDVWVQYKRCPTTELRNWLMKQYEQVVFFQASKIHAHLPDSVELGDLIQDGTFGLMEAIEGFDLARGVKFETYCVPRVRGAMLDGLRMRDWVPRLVRSNTSKMHRAKESLRLREDRVYTDDEVADEMGISPADYMKIDSDALHTEQESLDKKFYETESGREIGTLEVAVDSRSSDPHEAEARREFWSGVTLSLNKQERIIILMYYVDGLRMKQIGEEIGLSESRVSQMHSQIIERLQAKHLRNSSDREQMFDLFRMIES